VTPQSDYDRTIENEVTVTVDGHRTPLSLRVSYSGLGEGWSCYIPINPNEFVPARCGQVLQSVHLDEEYGYVFAEYDDIFARYDIGDDTWYIGRLEHEPDSKPWTDNRLLWLFSAEDVEVDDP
jgi:hypothetical protein